MDIDPLNLRQSCGALDVIVDLVDKEWVGTVKLLVINQLLEGLVGGRVDISEDPVSLLRVGQVLHHLQLHLLHG